MQHVIKKYSDCSLHSRGIVFTFNGPKIVFHIEKETIDGWEILPTVISNKVSKLNQ